MISCDTNIIIFETIFLKEIKEDICLTFNLIMFKWFLLHSGSRSSKTFKPKKNIPEGTHQYDLMKHAAATLGSGNLRLAVMLPEGEDLNEWVAVNSMYFKLQVQFIEYNL